MKKSFTKEEEEFLLLGGRDSSSMHEEKFPHIRGRVLASEEEF
jgi:hypothetical protein